MLKRSERSTTSDRSVLPSRDRLLADLTASLAELKLDVLGGDIATDSKGRAVDTLRIRDRRASVATSQGGSSNLTPTERAKSLGERVDSTWSA